MNYHMEIKIPNVNKLKYFLSRRHKGKGSYVGPKFLLSFNTNEYFMLIVKKLPYRWFLSSH